MDMEYTLQMGLWNSVFAVPTALVDRYLKLAGKEQLQVLLWMLRHPGEAVSTEELSAELGLDQDSVLGRFGSRCARAAHWALRHGVVFAVGSDAHDIKGRTPELGTVWEHLQSLYGANQAVQLLQLNPLNVVSDRGRR